MIYFLYSQEYKILKSQPLGSNLYTKPKTKSKINSRGTMSRRPGKKTHSLINNTVFKNQADPQVDHHSNDSNQQHTSKNVNEN